MNEVGDTGADQQTPTKETAGANAAAVFETVQKTDTTKSPTLGSELLYADAGNVEATNVTLEHSGAEKITAERATVEHSDVKSLDAKSVQMVNSGALKVKAERAVFQNGGAVIVNADELRFVKSKAVIVNAGRVTTEGNVQSMLHIGPVEGDIRTVFTPQSAIGFGAGLGIVLIFLGGIFRRVFGR
jgi:hypothetical protein